MDEQNITVINNDTRFNFRVAILIENNERVLLEKNKDFWNMIGGRVHFGNDTLESAKREIQEELGINVDNLKLINVSENFFNWLDKKQHELLFVYSAKLDDSYEITKQEEIKCLDSNEIFFKWHKKEDVSNLICKPQIIYDLVYHDKQITHTIKNEL